MRERSDEDLMTTYTRGDMSAFDASTRGLLAALRP
jgi:hypothetical protein